MRHDDVFRMRWLWQPTPDALLGLMMAGPNLSGAACAGPQAGLFDDRRDEIVGAESPTARSRRHVQAIALCARCPVQQKCLAARLADESLGPGIFGGRLFENAPYSKICPCGVSFTSSSKHQRYHDSACREAQQEKRRRTRKKGKEVVAA